tara:strand:- start:581 stop:820 length:240 start_codon:yes stop_codon:yes gene_type:complete
MKDLKKDLFSDNFTVIKNNWFELEAKNLFGQQDASYRIVKDIIECSTPEQLWDLLLFYTGGLDIDLEEFIINLKNQSYE